MKRLKFSAKYLSLYRSRRSNNKTLVLMFVSLLYFKNLSSLHCLRGWFSKLCNRTHTMTYYQFADNIFLFFNHKKEGKQRKKQNAPGYLHTGSLFVSLRVVWIHCLYYHFESRSLENAFSFTGKYLSHETANNKTWNLCPNKDISQEILSLAEILSPWCQFLSA